MRDTQYLFKISAKKRVSKESLKPESQILMVTQSLKMEYKSIIHNFYYENTG